MSLPSKEPMALHWLGCIRTRLCYWGGRGKDADLPTQKKQREDSTHAYI